MRCFLGLLLVLSACASRPATRVRVLSAEHGGGVHSVPDLNVRVLLENGGAACPAPTVFMEWTLGGHLRKKTADLAAGERRELTLSIRGDASIGFKPETATVRVVCGTLGG
jgi:hypothetical protein